jgi:aminoglycoside phosphotransferase (APT) family kinase protein
MAIANSIDPRDAEPRLTAWLSGKLPAAVVSDVAVPPASGGSNETVFFTATWPDGDATREQRMVARVLPSGLPLFPTYDLHREYTVMRAVAEGSAIPVPAVDWFEADPSILGAPFMTMPFVAGRVLGDDPPFTTSGWFLDLSAEQQATLHDNGLRQLAAIHALDWQALGLEPLRRPERGVTAIDQQLAYWEEFFAWAAEGDANPTVEAGLRWLREHQPQDERLALSWGDARLGNMLFADDLSVAAVLDWEMAAIAAPELDLAWWLFLNHHHTDGIGAPRPAGLPTEAETVARYEELTGRPVQDLHYYKVFAGVRMSALMIRVARLMVAGGILPPDATLGLNNPASQMLAGLLDLERADAAQVTTFAGVFQDRG